MASRPLQKKKERHVNRRDLVSIWTCRRLALLQSGHNIQHTLKVWACDCIVICKLAYTSGVWFGKSCRIAKSTQFDSTFVLQCDRHNSRTNWFGHSIVSRFCIAKYSLFAFYATYAMSAFDIALYLGRLVFVFLMVEALPVIESAKPSMPMARCCWHSINRPATKC